MNPFLLKQSAIAVVAAVVFTGGWSVRGWYEDSKDLAAAEAIEKSRELMRELANDISKNTETAIGEIRVENKTVYQQATKEVVRDVVYRDCRLTDDGLRAANQARSGAATGKPDHPLPPARPAP
jgi:hypothetical protein